MRITRPFVLLALAALLAPRIEASRTSVWESNPPASLTATRADATGLLAALAPVARLAPAAADDAETTETPLFNLGDVVLVDTAGADAEHFDLGPLTLVDLNLLRGPPSSYPETRVGGFELLPPFRIGASPRLSLWTRQACGFSCREVASDSRYDPWGLKAECPVGYWLEDGRCVNDVDEVPVIDRELEFAERALHTKDPCYPIPCMRAVTPDQQIARNLEKQAARERLVAARDELEEGLAHWAEGPQLPPIVGGPKAPSRTVRARPSRGGTPRRGVNLVRPKIGRGVFDREPLDRGKEAEKNDRLLPGGRGSLPYTEPVIDQVPATSATTVDLALTRYSTLGGLRSRILEKARPLETYPASPKVLRVGVPDSHYLTAEQARAIQQLTTELGQRGIQLVVVPIR